MNLDVSLVEDLIRMAEEHQLVELDVHYKNYKIYIKRAANIGDVNTEGPQRPLRISSPSPKRIEEFPANMTVVRSPLSGIFYRASSPESPAFVESGDPVTAGQVICLIEAMKLMNEITSEVSGVVDRFLVENGSPVESQQPLVHIRAS